MYILWRIVLVSVIYNVLIKYFLDDIYKIYYFFEDGFCGGSSKGVYYIWVVY